MTTGILSVRFARLSLFQKSRSAPVVERPAAGAGNHSGWNCSGGRRLRLGVKQATIDL